MCRTACTEPQCLYKGALYLYLTVELYLYSLYGPYGLYRASVPVQGCTLPLPNSRAIPVLPLWAVRSVQSLSACTRVHFTFTLLYLNFLDRSSKNAQISNFFQIRPVRDDVFHADGWTDGTDVHDEANSRLSRFCERTWRLPHPPFRLQVTEHQCPARVCFGMAYQMHIKTKYPSFSLSNLRPDTEHPKIF